MCLGSTLTSKGRDNYNHEHSLSFKMVRDMMIQLWFCIYADLLLVVPRQDLFLWFKNGYDPLF